MRDLANLCSGEQALATVSTYKPVTMLSGVASLFSVEPHISKSNNKGLKLVFRTLGAPNDETKGHHEYISTSSGDKFEKEFNKLRYLVEHCSNQAVKDAFKAVPQSLSLILNEQGQPILFKTDEELKAIREAYGEDTTFVWAENEANERVAVKFTDIEATLTALHGVFSMLIGSKYKLEITKDGDFQNLKSIGLASIVVPTNVVPEKIA